MASAISSTGTSVAQDVYSDLFISTSIDKTQSTGPDFIGIEVWATAGTAVLEFNQDTGDTVTVASTDSVHYFRCLRPTSKLRAKGSGAGATVAWRQI